MSDIAKPLPEVTELTRPLLEAAHSGELRLQRCIDCEHVRYPVGPVCTECLSDQFEWAKMSGKGEVLSHIVFHRAYHAGWRDEVPYSVVMVQLAEGPRMFSNIVDPDKRFIDEDLVGREVQVEFEDVMEGLAIPRFVVVDDPGLGREHN